MKSVAASIIFNGVKLFSLVWFYINMIYFSHDLFLSVCHCARLLV